MPVAPYISELMSSSSFIRKMFEEGMQLKTRFGADKVYDFSIGNPDLEPPPKVKEMLRDLGKLDKPALHAYMPNAGYPETRTAMAKKVSREQGVAIEGAQVIMGVGAAGALNSVLKAILSSGDEVLVSAPYFVEYTQYVRNHGGTLKTVPTKSDFSLDVEGIERSLSERTAAIIINSPNNPTGKIYSTNEIKALAAALERFRNSSGKTVMIIADEPYREIVYDGRAVAAIFPFWADSVICSSFAKNLSLPGERIGYTAVNPAAKDASHLVDAIIYATRVLGFVNAPATFQRIVAACWDEPVDYSSYEIRRNSLTENLSAAGIEYAIPEGAFYLFCKVPAKKSADANAKLGADDVEFCDHLKKYNILGVPGRGFGKPGWFRLAYCVSLASIRASKEAFMQAMSEWN